MKSKSEEINDYQKELIEHTISGHDRNWFATDKNTKDSKEFEDLVKKGYAISRKAPSWSGDDVVYILTEKGKNFIKGKSKVKWKMKV